MSIHTCRPEHAPVRSSRTDATHWDQEVLARLYGPARMDSLTKGLWRTIDFPVIQTDTGALDLTTEAIETFYSGIAQGGQP